jgi:hypothetical protein
MGYDLTIRKRGAQISDTKLHLSVWEMSLIRDQMLACGAAFCADPPDRGAGLPPRRSSVHAGIPAYKLAMIDGFSVRPAEIREALNAIELSTLSIDDRLWKKWLDFLELASAHGGFIVE